MNIAHVELKTANAFVTVHHRHHKAVTGHRFSIGCFEGDRLLGVAIVGRPVARAIDQTYTVEVLRLCTDGTYNACSMLYGAVRRAAKALGYSRIITYTLASENIGASLRASGWRLIGPAGGGSWNRPSRPRDDNALTGRKQLWQCVL